jgi:hypothetical protein
MQSFHSDILYSINRFLNPIDCSLLKCTCKRFFDYWENTPKIKNINDLFIYSSLQWIQRKQIKPNRDQVALLAKYGHLEVLKWAHLNGCPWDEITCSRAAENGHLEVLQWLRQNGCPWNEDTCRYAAH